ncbi:MAG TPA: hypothetical protein VG826_19900 [Pirellulales bacterium]|nr:hypothetical protein [Pirellulales bacterium]
MNLVDRMRRDVRLCGSLALFMALAGMLGGGRLRADDPPSLADRTAALAAIQAAGGEAWPDIEKLRARGERQDLFNVKHEFQAARFEPRGKVPDEAIAALAAFPELERLDLPDATDDQLARLRLPNLKILDLNHAAVTDRGLEHLRPLKKLETLDLNHTAVTGRGFQALTALKNLQSVNLASTPASDAGIAPLAQFPNLAVVTLNKTGVGDIALQHLRNGTNLRQLGLQQTQIGDAGLAALERLNKLAVLALDETRVGDTGMEAIAHLPRLSKLTLAGTRVTDASTSVIAGWGDLTLLDLSGTAITELGVKRLHGLKNLVSLQLRGTRLSDAALQALAKMDKLETLDLADTPIADAGLAYLKPLVSLRRLDLSRTRVSGPGLESLADLPRLGSVRVTGANVSLFYLNVLAVQTALNEKTEMDFANQPLSDVVEYIAERHEIGVQLDYKSMSAAGVGSDTPITAKRKGVTLRDALQTVLEPLGLAFTIHHEVLLITSKPLPKKTIDLPVLPDGEPLSPKLAEALSRPSGLDLKNRSLKGLAADLSKSHNIEIELDDECLARDMRLEKPLTRFVKGITLKSALELILSQFDLVCVAEADKMVIRTGSDL